MKDQDVRTKFTENSELVVGAEHSAAILEGWWKIADLSATELAVALDLLDRRA
jgi:hypothetical protein